MYICTIIGLEIALDASTHKPEVFQANPVFARCSKTNPRYSKTTCFFQGLLGQGMYSCIFFCFLHTPGPSKGCLKGFRYNSCHFTIPLGVDPWHPGWKVCQPHSYKRDYNNPYHQCAVYLPTIWLIFTENVWVNIPVPYMDAMGKPLA